MVTDDELLRAMPLLGQVPREELAGLAAERIELSAGETFFRQGEEARHAWGVITGRVRIVKEGAENKPFCLNILGPGDLVGAVAVLRRVPMPASAIAIEATACVRVEAEVFRSVLRQHPSAQGKALDLMARRLLEAANVRHELATCPVESRLACALLRMAGRYGAEHRGEIVFSQALTRQSLADLAGTTVESAIRVMSRWTRAGVLRSSAGRLTISRPHELERLTGSVGTTRKPAA
jgi:CRP/FNR family transcriptional regulator, nitrogen oxide reductase regulator